MKRFSHRLFGIALGLGLGWLAASQVSWLDSAMGDDQPAAQQADTDHAKSHVQRGTTTHTHDGHTHDHAKGDHAHKHDHGSAKHLVPDAEDAPFYGSVLFWTVALAAGAVVIGVFLRALGEQDPGVRAGEEDARDTAHHDDHGGHEDGDSHASTGGNH